MFYLECDLVQYYFVLFLNAMNLDEINLFQGKVDLMDSLLKAFLLVLLTLNCL